MHESIAPRNKKKELEGDEATEPDVLGLVQHTHPAATELFEDAVV